MAGYLASFVPAPSLLSSWEFSDTKFSEFLFGYVKRRKSGKGSFNFHEVEMKLWDGFLSLQTKFFFAFTGKELI